MCFRRFDTPLDEADVTSGAVLLKDKREEAKRSFSTKKGGQISGRMQVVKGKINSPSRP